MLSFECVSTQASTFNKHITDMITCIASEQDGSKAYKNKSLNLIWLCIGEYWFIKKLVYTYTVVSREMVPESWSNFSLKVL